ncbi:ABC transporter ATP-binding protein [Dactylosporangium sucinum]|uniref:ABC transporter n=1 Tax=Dactylosporangium sucinum TaxID=1424081 RepID=A0A917UD43_9ACTN|nr:ABC transporter ATP-binding protein [Dactylosporangium sucinum]GGM84153.1 ABC transporter [Dactylosporangium sucinum]
MTGDGPRRRLGRSLLAALRLGWRASPGLLLLSAGLTVLASALPAAAAWASKLLVDRLTRGEPDDGALVLLMAAVIGLGGVALLLGHLGAVATAAQQRAITIHAEGGLYAAISGFPGLRYFEDPVFRDRIQLAEQSAQVAPRAVSDVALSLVRTAVTIGSFLGVVIAVWWPMVFLLLAAAVPAILMQSVLARRKARTSEAIMSQSRQRLQYQMLLTDLEAVKEIRLFGLGGLFQRRIAGHLADTSRRELRTERGVALTQALLTLFSVVVTVGGAVVVVLQAAAGRLTAGDVLLFVAAVGGVQGAFGGSVVQLSSVGQALYLFGHYLDVTGTPPDLVDGDRDPGRLREGIEFHDVWFRYSEQAGWALRGVSLRIPAGVAVGLAGANGAGKSTIVKLLCRLYDPDRGRITWDGVDLRDLRLADLRRRMGVTFQDYVTYELSAAENIGVGAVAAIADRDRIRQAAARAGADDVIEALPHGYDTMLTRLFSMNGPQDSGVMLSGGQAQRVAVARSFMRPDADLFIHDEPTSALDPLAAEQVGGQLEALRGDRTAVVISHRLAALRSAATIVVLDAGEVVEQGTHDGLMTADGVYARMFSAQAAGYQDDRVDGPGLAMHNGTQEGIAHEIGAMGFGPAVSGVVRRRM